MQTERNKQILNALFTGREITVETHALQKLDVITVGDTGRNKCIILVEMRFVRQQFVKLFHRSLQGGKRFAKAQHRAINRERAVILKVFEKREIKRVHEGSLLLNAKCSIANKR